MATFFTLFERAAHALGMGKEDDLLCTALLSKLKGSALAWAQGVQGEQLGAMGYAELKEALLTHFKQEGLIHVRALQRIKQQGDKLEEYNLEFAQKAAAAAGLMHDIQVKDVYVAGLSSTKMRE